MPQTGGRRKRVRRGVELVVCALIAVGAVVTAPTAIQESTARVLAGLGSLDSNGIERFVHTHREDVLEVVNARPGDVARAWPQLSDAERARLETTAPGVVGNLDGVPYATRDQANRRVLGVVLPAAAAAAAAHPDDQAAAMSLAAYTAIRAALTAKTHPARHLVEFVPGTRPAAAIAVGDPETAAMVTWAIPGMGTYTTDMQLWSLAAQNIWESQRQAGAAGHAVIAWMGYAVPPVGIDAALGEYATRGAPALTEAIEGLEAYRRLAPPVVNVVAHSYGTTMAADALADTDLGVSSFVMLGSAGVEERIPTAADLHAGAVYAGEAAADGEADLGRASRYDPRSPSFGARILPVDGDASAGLAPVTGHAPILHSAYNDDIASPVWTVIASPKDRERAFALHLSQHGYLDTGTQSLHQVGAVTVVDRSPAERAPLAGGVSPLVPGPRP